VNTTPEADEFPKRPADILAAIRANRNGAEQASGQLAALQAALGDDELCRIDMQVGYALGYCHSTLGQPPDLAAAALAWTAAAEMIGPAALGIIHPTQPGAST
jgi:hypothetical protein